MPRRTDGEKIDELEKVVATLLGRVDYYADEKLDSVGAAIVDVSKGLQAIQIKVAVLNRDLEAWHKRTKRRKTTNKPKLLDIGPLFRL